MLASIVAVQTIGQVALINDPDGYTNVREGKNTNAAIIYQVKNNEVFFIDEEYFEVDSLWIKVWISSNAYSRTVASDDISGFIHRSRIRPIESLAIAHGDIPELIFSIERADTTRIFDFMPYGLEGFLSESFEVTKLQLIWKGQIINQDELLFDDLYNMTFETGDYSSHQGRFTTYQQGDVFFIHQKCADGAGYYEIVWVISDGKIIQRLAGWMI